MTDTTNTSETTSETPPVEDQASTTTETETPATETPPAEKPKEELPPEVLRAKLTEANAEAANYRTRLREAEATLATAKTPEEVQAAIADLQSKNALLEKSLLVTKVASEFKLPADLAAVLQGDDEAALTLHAKALAKYVPAEETDPASLSGGLTPGDAEEFDPVAEARKARTNRY